MKTKTNHTIAARLLSIVFEGHPFTAVFHHGRPVFHFYETAAACGISKARDFARKHLEAHHLLSIFVDSRSANGVLQKRAVQFLTQSGMLAMVMASRKPAARRLQAFILDEVLPQLIELGTFIPGITQEQRLVALGLRYRQELAAQRAGDAARVAVTGWLPFSAYWAERGLPVALAPLLASRLEARAIAAGIFPERLRLPGQKKNPVNTWPRPLLELAEADLIPRLEESTKH